MICIGLSRIYPKFLIRIIAGSALSYHLWVGMVTDHSEILLGLLLWDLKTVLRVLAKYQVSSDLGMASTRCPVI